MTTVAPSSEVTSKPGAGVMKGRGAADIESGVEESNELGRRWQGGNWGPQMSFGVEMG
jgi:hypothetical protein